MTILFSNNASTTISGSITATDLTVALASGTGVIFPQPTGGDYFVCTFYDQQTKTINEIVHVTNITGDVATIVRAQEGTTAKAWNTGDIFANLITAGTLRAFVQAGTGPADTSIVYVGTDTGTPNHIVAVTNPVPPNLATGMLFNILLKNANTSATDMALNGLPAHLCKHTDGSDFTRGDVFAGLEYTFVWNGQTFSSTIMNVPKRPPQTTFYVRADSTSIVDSNGIESNTGFANTPQDAFRTIQGAMNTIQALYISSQTITLRVADGTYTSGFQHSSQYISQYEVIGNQANPGNCLIDCTSVNVNSYVPGSPTAICASVGEFGNVILSGFSFKSFSPNIVGGVGVMQVSDCNLSSPTSGNRAIVECVLSANMQFFGNIHIATPQACTAVFQAWQNGLIYIGVSDYFGQDVLNLYFDGTVTGSAFMHAFTGGVMLVHNDTGSQGNTIVVHGGPFNGYEYLADTSGGIDFSVGTTYFPATQPGIATPPGYVT
jgi:hypothetical protein